MKLPAHYRISEYLFSLFRDIRNGYGILNTAVAEFRKIKTISDIYPGLHSLEYKDAIKIINDYITSHPEVEHWEYMRYIPGRDNSKLGGIFKGIKVSTKGNFCWVYSNKLMRSKGATKTTNKEHYLSLTVMNYSWLAHRAVASTFIPLPEDISPLLLETNHEDGIKINNDYLNLSWMTSEQNVQHSHQTGLAKVKYGNGKDILLTVIADNKLQGNNYILKGGKVAENMGFSSGIIYQAIINKTYVHGCKARYVDDNEIKNIEIRDIKELADYYTSTPKDFNTNIVTLKGTIAFGPFKGMSFILRGTEELSKYGMDSSNIHRVLNKRKQTAYKCVWKKVMLKNNLTQPRTIEGEVFDWLVRKPTKEDSKYLAKMVFGPFIGQEMVIYFNKGLGLNK